LKEAIFLSHPYVICEIGVKGGKGGKAEKKIRYEVPGNPKECDIY
jgi:hypothetical protein